MREDHSAVPADALRDELMAVPGVASAEVDLTDANAPAGVRVRLSADADARRVGAEVQRILASHGMRSRFAATPESPIESGPAVPTVVAAEVSGGDESPAIPPPPVEAPPEPPETLAAVPDPPAAARPQTAVLDGLDAVAVEERSDGLSVRVALHDGRSGSHGLPSEDSAVLDDAVVAAVASALEVEAELVATEWMEVEGASIVTVVVRRPDGTLAAGAGIVRVGRAFAVGIGAHAALSN
jgi:hypothetical protein